MTDIQVFAFFVLPVVIVAVGAVVMLLELRAQHAAHPRQPDLFIPEARPRNLANSDGLRPPSKRQR